MNASRLVYILFFIMLLPCVYSATLEQNFSSYVDGNIPLRFSAAYTYVGYSTVTVNHSYNLSFASYPLKRIGSPSGYVWVELYNASDPNVNTQANMIGMSNVLNASDFSTATGGSWGNFTFNGTGLALSNQTIFTVFKGSYALSTTNHLRIVDYSPGSINGRISNGGITWSTDSANRELPFMFWSNQGGNYMLITATDSLTGSAISNLSAAINLSNGSQLSINTTTGTINTTILRTFSGTLDIVISSNEGYFNKGYTGINASNDLSATLDRTYLSGLTYGNYVTYSGANYSRNLSVNMTITGCYGALNLTTYINGQVNASTAYSCPAQVDIPVTKSYMHSSEGTFQISYGLRSTDTTNLARYTTQNATFISDLYAPVTTLAYNLSNGTVSNITLNASLKCVDSVLSPLEYLISLDGTRFIFGNYTNATTQTNASAYGPGEHTLIGSCSDLFLTNTTTYTFTQYGSTIILWDEIDNVAFNLSNIAGAKLWIEDNATPYDFKAANRNNISIVSDLPLKFRIEQNFSNGDGINRYLDLSTLTEDLTKVCTNKNGITHYAQIIYSSQIRYAALKNSYNGCYILSDYTRFAYQGAYSVLAYTISSNYFIQVYTSGVLNLLASLDGITQQPINLDNIEFTNTGYDVNLKDDALSVSFDDTTNTTTISYQNIEEDNEQVSLAIYRGDNNSLLLNTTNTVSPNLFSVDFVFSSYPNTNASTVFVAVATITKSDGSVTTRTIVFDGLAKSGYLIPAIGITLSVMLLIGGLSMFSTQAQFSWIGIFIVIAALVVNIMTQPNEVSTFLYAIEGIALVYFGIIMINGNYIAKVI